MDRESNNFKRNVTKVELWAAYNQPRMRGLVSLTDPMLLPYKGEGILIAGVELHSEDGGQTISEHRQVWLCSPAIGTEADWARDQYERSRNSE